MVHVMHNAVLTRDRPRVRRLYRTAVLETKGVARLMIDQVVIEAVVLQIRCEEEDSERVEFPVSGHIVEPGFAIPYGATRLRTRLCAKAATGRVLYEVLQLNSGRAWRLRALVLPLPEGDSTALQPIPVV